MNKATGAGFEVLLSINNDFTYFNTFRFSIMTAHTNNKLSTQYDISAD